MREKRIIYADASIFDVFTIPLILGDSSKALTDPNTIVITQTTAKKYFGNENPLGKSLKLKERKTDYKITGLVEDCPASSHFQFDMIASLVSIQSSDDDSWMGHCYFTYIVLRDDVLLSKLEAKFPDFINRHYGPKFMSEIGMSYEKYLKDENHYYGYYLQPLLDIHLNVSILDNLPGNGNINYIYIFSAIALLILLIACINFMNLSTARFTQRSKEVGVRKVLGSSQKQLILQFLCESILFSLIALVLALLIVEISLPAFSSLAGRELQINYFGNTYILLAFSGFALVVGILAGSYPAFFLSSFKPVQTIKGTLEKMQGGHLHFRQTLVVLQFTITTFILIGTFIINSQLRYVRNKDLGFNKEHIVVIHRANVIRSQGDTEFHRKNMEKLQR